MISAKKRKNRVVWDRINMRNVNHLLGVEFMHNLYDRHLPRINSIRFRNTVTIWKNGVVNSFAPKNEWSMLSDWLGEKFFILDKTLMAQVENLIKIDRKFLFEFIENLEHADIKKIDNIRLALSLIDLQEFTLGEIYVVNLVQIEHSLTCAILRVLEEYEKDTNKKLKLLADLITAKELTEFQKEEINFDKIVNKGKKNSVFNPRKNKQIFSLINEHCKKYTYMHCAYGEEPLTVDYYLDKYKKLFNQNISPLEILTEISKKYNISCKKLKALKNTKLNKLIPIMSNLGIFRDKNKALLGQTVKYRIMILDEIARRRVEDRDALNYYLLSEILDLLRFGKKLSRGIVKKRKTDGVRLIRKENLDYMKDNIVAVYLKKTTLNFSGICASPGIVDGVAKIVISKKDAQKINKGDIMVAIGTDFDLMPAMEISSGVITEEGGLLSHASVFCRELKKPCCIGVNDATKLLRDGQLIRLDATNGKILILN